MQRVLTQSMLAAVLVSALGAAPSLHETTIRRIVPKIIEKTPETKPYQVGKASWYGSLFDGKLTASGESYDMNKLTAAHPLLPLGSFVKVTNLSNKRTVIVRINDRGPITPGRVIDLSYKAAETLQFKHKGIQKVRLDVVDDPATVLTAETQPIVMLVK